MPRPLLLLALLSAACAEPFEVNRKDLGPFRIAALGVEGGVARAAIWSGEGMVHPSPPSLSWTLDGGPLGEGYEVSVAGGGTLGLTVTSPDGEVLEAELSVAEAPAAPGVSRYALGQVEDVSLDARRALDPEPVAQGVPEGEAARLVLDALPEGYSARWMSAEGLGTLLEVEADAADLFPEELEFDDGALISRTDSGAGVYHQLALVFDGAGSNAWTWIDVSVGLDTPFLRQGERLVPLESALEPGTYALTVSVDAESPGGLAFSEAVATEDLDEMDLACARAGAPFTLDQVAEGRCAADTLDGARVVMVLE
ncbi:MAG: hypothetical protein H6741_31475 [Alphaproteobacteria bacterium]|nr:hypothetical protein [Alphaproteobacteria bacterium]